MSMRLSIILAGLVLIAGVAFAMSDIYVSGTWRYRITVEVETPEGLKSGSAVREAWASASSIRIGLPESTSKTHVRGEAVVVDLGERGVLFGLINQGAGNEVSEAFPYTAAKGIPDRIRHFKNLKLGSKGELAPDSVWFVAFKDINDPQSIETVNTGEFEHYFGSDVHLKRIDIEITNDPVTWGAVQKTLKWFG